MTDQWIPFNWPHMTGQELDYIREAHDQGCLAGDGPFTKKCEGWLEQMSGSPRALLTHSCTAALEMSALLLDISPGDEVIMPSYTFVSTANAFCLRGATPVFVDIRPDTLNIDEHKIEAAITRRTRAIVVVHYAGVSCEMDPILELAERHGLSVIEDAAQGLMSTYRGRALGTMGDFGTYSFHETKNIISGEGGALLINNQKFVQRAEIIREKGTDRSRFFRGEVDRYTWRDLGSSYLPGDLLAAFLWAQFEQAADITRRRKAAWQRYHRLLEPIERRQLLRCPVIPQASECNGHLYYVLLPAAKQRAQVIEHLTNNQINAVFHYIPLHQSPAGRRYGRISGELTETEALSARLIRLPLWVGITEEQQERVVQALEQALSQ